MEVRDWRASLNSFLSSVSALAEVSLAFDSECPFIAPLPPYMLALTPLLKETDARIPAGRGTYLAGNLHLEMSQCVPWRHEAGPSRLFLNYLIAFVHPLPWICALQKGIFTDQ